MIDYEDLIKNTEGLEREFNIVTQWMTVDGVNARELELTHLNIEDIEKTEFGYICYFMYDSKRYGNFITKWVYEGEYSTKLRAVRIYDKPTVWDSPIKEFEDLISILGRDTRHLRNIVNSLVIISSRALNTGVTIVTGIKSKFVKKLKRLGLLAVRTKQADNLVGVSRTYWVNPVVNRMINELQYKLGIVIPINPTIEIDERYKKFFDLLFVLDCYLLSFGLPWYGMELTKSTNYVGKLKGRMNNIFSNRINCLKHESRFRESRQKAGLVFYNLPDKRETLFKHYWYFDVSASVPRLLAALNGKGLFRSDQDVYYLIYKIARGDTAESEEKFKRDRKWMKNLVSTLIFRPDLADEDNMIYLTAINQLIGANTYQSEIFILESFLYLLVLAKLYIRFGTKYNINLVYDCFEFYGDHPSEDLMHSLVRESTIELVCIMNSGDYRVLENLKSSIKQLNGYYEPNRYDIKDAKEIHIINILDRVLWHESIILNESEFSRKVNSYVSSENLEIEGNAYQKHTDAYSKGTDAYSTGTDAYSLGLDAYSLGMDKKSLEEDEVSIKFNKLVGYLFEQLIESFNPREYILATQLAYDKENKIVFEVDEDDSEELKNYIISEKTRRNLYKRKAFKENFTVKKSKVKPLIR